MLVQRRRHTQNNEECGMWNEELGIRNWLEIQIWGSRFGVGQIFWLNTYANQNFANGHALAKKCIVVAANELSLSGIVEGHIHQHLKTLLPDFCCVTRT